MKNFYPFADIEKKVQKRWEKANLFQTSHCSASPKFFPLEMFPYPSGKSLHMGHPLNYIPIDIIVRYKRSQGYNVLRTIGFDSFGLPAEQYALRHNIHPAITTKNNIQAYIKQLKSLGLAIDWSRSVNTSDPDYYKWTQWIFIQFFESWYNFKEKKAFPISDLRKIFEKEGNIHHHPRGIVKPFIFSSSFWKEASEEKKETILMDYRLAYRKETEVQWCPKLSTVLAHDEVKGGFSERGNHPVERKKMKQWLLRISAYSDRLLDRLEEIDLPVPLKKIQRNWIGRSEGFIIQFSLVNELNQSLDSFTTRPETLYGVSFLALSINHHLIDYWKKENIDLAQFIAKEKKLSIKKSFIDKDITGYFTGKYVYHPITKEKIPIWVTNYVVEDYGTSVVMAAPQGDERDRILAEKKSLPMPSLKNGDLDLKEIRKQLLPIWLKENWIRKAVSYRMRDTVFSRQRRWGEPIPIYYKKGIPYSLPLNELPLKSSLNENEEFFPKNRSTAKTECRYYKDKYILEKDTMPSSAGSSWYFLRYIDPHNMTTFANKEKLKYWKNVDLYIGGREHATGHLLFIRFWIKFLYDRGWIYVDEPFKKMVNQGMIQGNTYFVYRIKASNTFVSLGLKDNYTTTAHYVSTSLVKGGLLNIEGFKKWRPDLVNATFILENEKYKCGHSIEKMSKSHYNIVKPEKIIDKYGADVFRLHLMFLGPITKSKPWSEDGITGIVRFLNRIWQRFSQEEIKKKKKSLITSKVKKKCYTTIFNVTRAMDSLDFHKAISFLMTFMHTIEDDMYHPWLLSIFIRLLAPLTPHISEQLWENAGENGFVINAPYPKIEKKWIQEEEHTYPIVINKKKRNCIVLSAKLSQEDMKKKILQLSEVKKWISGKRIKKMIIIPERIVNIVTD